MYLTNVLYSANICCAIDLQSLCQHAKGSRWWFKCGVDDGVNFVVVLMSWWLFKGGGGVNVVLLLLLLLVV